MKILKRVVLALLVLGLLGALGAGLFLDSIVKSVIEKGGSSATGVATTLQGADASFFSGSFGLKGLALANPPGFRPEPFLACGEARARWQYGTILSDELVVDEFRLQGLTLNLERSSAGSNWDVILGNLSGGKPEQKPEPAPEEGNRKVMVFRRIELADVRCALHLAGLSDVAVELPTVVIEDLRTDGSALEIAATLTRAIVTAVLQQAASSGKGLFPADVLGNLQGGLKSLEQSLRGELDRALKGGELERTLQEGQKNLQELFGKPKKP